jgi:hypothetical protein
MSSNATDEFETKYKGNFKKHKAIHLSADILMSADAIHWYKCDKCEFKTKWKSYIKSHKNIHLSADAVQWYSCDKCKYKTQQRSYLKTT